MKWQLEETWSAHVDSFRSYHIWHVEGGGYELQVEDRHCRRIICDNVLYPTFELAEAAAEQFHATGRKLPRPWDLHLEHSHGGHMHTHEHGDVPHTHDPVSER